MNIKLQSLLKKKKIRPIILLQPLNKINEVIAEREDDKLINRAKLDSIPQLQPFSTKFNLKNKHFALTSLHPIANNPLKSPGHSESLLSKYFNAVSRDNLQIHPLPTKNLLKTNSITSTSITPTCKELSQDSSHLFKSKSSLFLSELSTPKQKIIIKSNSNKYLKCKATESHEGPRLRSYQPDIDINWKTKSGLTQKKNKLIPVLVNSVEFQIQSFQEQIGLLLDNINHFKCHIVRDDCFHKAFNSMPQHSKVSLNKNLEELCGILLLSPQAMLVEFYQYVEELGDVYLPHKKKLEEVYVKNEDDCFRHNFALLIELTAFFTKCFEFYLTLTKEVDGINFKEKYFNCIIAILERARYDISLIIQRGESAIKMYQADMSFRARLKREDNAQMRSDRHVKHSTPPKLKSESSVIRKIVDSYLFHKKGERERISRITNAIQSSKECFNDGEDIVPPYKPKHGPNIIKSKVMCKLMKYFNTDIQQTIISSEIEQCFKSPKMKKRIVSINL